MPPTPPQQCFTPITIFVYSSSDEESFPAAFSSCDEPENDDNTNEVDGTGKLIPETYSNKFSVFADAFNL